MRVLSFFDSKPYSIAALLLIIFSVINWATFEIYPNQGSLVRGVFSGFESATLILFLSEYLARATLSEKKWNYVFGIEGIVDALAVFPSVIVTLSGIGAETLWLRVFRLSRLFRLVKMKVYSSRLGGVAGRAIPYVAIAVLLKVILLVPEHRGFLNLGQSMNYLLGAAGFVIAMLLGSKLSTVNARLYALEDAVCRLVGGMRDMWSIKTVRADLLLWSKQLELFLRSSIEAKAKASKGMRELTDALEECLESNGVGGPNSASFHRDAAFVIHKATSSTPSAYDDFLRAIITTYVVTLIIVVPGLIGIISTALITFVVGGVYFLIEDIDSPLNYDDSSLIHADLEGLRVWNARNP